MLTISAVFSTVHEVGREQGVLAQGGGGAGRLEPPSLL